MLRSFGRHIQSPRHGTYGALWGRALIAYNWRRGAKLGTDRVTLLSLTVARLHRLGSM